VASRRASEDIIRSGRVTVNGEAVTELGSRARLDDDVRLDGKRLALESEKRYLLLNKPSGYISTMSDPAGRPLAVELLKPYVKERVYNVGRLDEWSSGLLIFTNDGELAALLGHPSGGVDKEYEVVTSVDIPDEFFIEFRAGLTIEGERYVALEAERKGPKGARIVLLEGKNREIRRALDHFGLRAKSLRRTRIGPLRLGDLPEGRFRELSPREIDELKKYHVPR
jgi:23S rRNA pseudouridine2605 synthase